jgi:ribonucleoside-diphosphate reductase alpha chain
MRKKGEDVLEGITTGVETGCGNVYIVTNAGADGKLAEVFASLGKSGGCARHWTEVIGRTISTLIRSDSDVKRLIKSLKGIKCQEEHSCADALASALDKFLAKKGDMDVTKTEGNAGAVGSGSPEAVSEKEG